MPFILVPITIVVLGILGFAHGVVYEAIVTILSVLCPSILSSIFLVDLRIIFVVLTLSFTAATFVSFWRAGLIARIFYKISAVWTGFLMYFFFAAFTYGVFVTVNEYAVHAFSVTLFSWSDLSLFGAVLFTAAFIVGVYGCIHANRIFVTRVPIQMPNIPKLWKGRRAVWISDIHLGHIRGARFMKKIVKKIQALKADIVFIGGDLYDGVAVDELAVIEPLRELCAHDTCPRGVYFVMGNHEEFSEKSRERFLRAIKSVDGIRVLEDECVTIDGVDIIGVDHEHASDRKRFSEILSRVRTHGDGGAFNVQRPSILLKHEPKDLDIACAAGISLQISGHTHKGQVFPATLLAWLVFPGFDYGLHEYKGMQVYTSSGVGTWGPPLRVGTRSEIVEFEFK
jgi:predicted MPP superfamily phosphohydrolase